MCEQCEMEEFGRDLELWDLTFRYQLLDRMRLDCEYFLGPGAWLNKYLWAGDPQLQIACMKALWDSFPEGQKPEWLTLTQLRQLEQRMKEEQM